MAKGIIQHIVQDLNQYSSQVLLVENTDQFLSREEVISTLLTYGIRVVQGSKIHQRVEFELREDDEVLLLLSQNNTDYLEDITRTATTIDFDLKTYFGGYHIPSIRKIEISILDILFSQKQIISLNRIETLQLIDRIRQERMPAPEVSFDIPVFIETLDKKLEVEPIKWSEVCKMISKAVLKSIRTSQVETLIKSLGETNTAFQENIKTSYQATKNSNAIKGPKIVSKILEYLSSNFLEKKVALIVVDGLAFWQYEILKDKLPNAKNEDVIYSWLPSITQLSRQAIFRGDTPQKSYQQGPKSEERLWKNFWSSKGINEFQIRYNHEKINLSNLEFITKFAIVFKDLDEKMHSSSDYKDLLDLTENWIERSDISNVVKTLKEEGFTVFLTTDHGNIQAEGWRGLKKEEKLATHKSGSRSTRHIEYEEKWVQEKFIANNPELIESLVMEGQSIWIKDNLSFSKEDTLVTHGGSHILEVLIPFIEI